MTILRTTLAITGLVLSSASLQAGFMTEANVTGGTYSSSYARAQDGVLYGGSIENFACAGGASSAGGVGGNVTNSFANITCQSGRAFGSADLATGALRTFALTNGINGLPAGTANANAQFSDEVIFNNSTGGNLLLGDSWLSHGTVTGETMGQTTRTSVLSNLIFSQPGGSQLITLQGSTSVHGLRFVYLNGATSIQEPFAGGTADLSGWTVSPVGPVGALFSSTLVVPSGISTLDIATILRLDCRNGPTCDFSNTAAFSFGALPTGLTYTSSSGAFLTGAPAATAPEPGTLAMLGVGLLTVGFLRRRKKGGNA